MKLRLDKMLAHCGYGSRKDVKLLIRKGEVLVNGEIIKNDDYKVDSDVDEIVVFDETVSYENKIYIMLNKPSGVVSATYDNFKQTVIDLVEPYSSYKIFPVGRLDIDTTGLLLITNDGQLCHNMLAPKKHVDKTYVVTVDKKLDNSLINSFKKGILLDDGYKAMPADLKIVNDFEGLLIIHEGKFHQVKRMFEALNYKVVGLKRISFGPLVLDDDLKEGSFRMLNEQELSLLKEYM